jgi:hypothetical protein
MIASLNETTIASGKRMPFTFSSIPPVARSEALGKCSPLPHVRRGTVRFPGPQLLVMTRPSGQMQQACPRPGLRLRFRQVLDPGEATLASRANSSSSASTTSESIIESQRDVLSNNSHARHMAPTDGSRCGLHPRFPVQVLRPVADLSWPCLGHLALSWPPTEAQAGC